MKIKDGFLLRKVAGQTIVIPYGGNVNFTRIITLNETGEYLWNLLSEHMTKQKLVEALLSEYEVEEAKASESVDNFLKKLKENNLLEE